ncbi:MAG: CHAT domain-containing protein [Reichenbachiella sp.]|uniref:CHAT domain-containing protein n=1 Tax=Reichenbachiella sp. TaxID=2184521 RepID=UPI0032667605
MKKWILLLLALCSGLLNNLLFAQKDEKLREQFFLSMLRSPENYRELIESYKSEQGKNQVLYEIYESAKPWLESIQIPIKEIIPEGYYEAAEKLLTVSMMNPSWYKQQYENFIKNNQEPLENKYDSAIEFAKTIDFPLRRRSGQMAKSVDEKSHELEKRNFVAKMERKKYEVGNKYGLVSYLNNILVMIREKKVNSRNPLSSTELDKNLYCFYQLIRSHYFQGSDLRMFKPIAGTHQGENSFTFQDVYQYFVLLLIELEYRTEVENDLPIPSLDSGESFVQVMRYGESNLNKITPSNIPKSYAVWVVTQSKPYPRLISIPGDENLDKQLYINYYSQYADSDSPKTTFSEDNSYYHYISPFYPALENSNKLYLIPEGVYKKIALETIRNGHDSYFGDDVVIIRVLNPNQISKYKDQKNQTFKTSELSYALFGNPAFHLGDDNKSVKREDSASFKDKKNELLKWTNDIFNQRPLNEYDPDILLSALPNSEIEVLTLNDLLNNVGWTGEYFIGNNAEESKIKALTPPKLLHIATHRSILPSSVNMEESHYEAVANISLLLAGSAQYMDKDINILFDNKKGPLAEEFEKIEKTLLISKVSSTYYDNNSFQNRLLQFNNSIKKGYLSLVEDLADGEIQNDNDYYDLLDTDEAFWKLAFGSKPKHTESGYNRNDGLLTAYEILYLNLKGTELVTLSACSSGVEHRSIVGEDLFGLSEAFMTAGAKSVLVSFWPVNDMAASKFMLLFYKFWLNGNSKREALQLAKNVIRTIPEYEHPFFWGGYVLFGAD